MKDKKRIIEKTLGANGSLALAILRAQVLHRADVAALKQVCNNKKFHNIHKGKRCFILGNGPSLKNVDLSKLQKEWVFTVNDFCKIDNYRAAHTNYHFLMDSAYFDDRKDIQVNMEEVLRNYDLIGKENAVCFFPAHAYGFLEKNGLLNKLNVNYLFPFYELRCENKINLDICKSITIYSTVVQYAITVAIYMGFSKIYLLGCDSTMLPAMFDKVLHKKNSAIHAYDHDDDEQNYEELLLKWDLSEIIFGHYKLFLGYEKISDYCEKAGIKLLNCSDPTLIMSIPRVTLKKIIRV